MLNRRLMHELESRKLLSVDQHAFRTGRGTETYFAALEGFLTADQEKKQVTNCAVIDLSKAFDRTWRWSILQQLKKWGFGGRLTAFIQDFLNDRFFQTRVGSTVSNFKSMENGVPQGAILSPTLFLVSIESLLHCIPKHTQIFIYAEDIILATSSSCCRTAKKILQRA